MSAVCRFCGGSFTNEQAVRAHLKTCAAYRERRAGQEPHAGGHVSASGSAPLGRANGGDARLGRAAESARPNNASAGASVGLNGGLAARQADDRGEARSFGTGGASIRAERAGDASAETRRFDGVGFDPVRQLERQIAAEELRLKLREVEEAHGEMDRRVSVKAKERAGEAHRQIEAQTTAQRQAEDERRRSEREQQEQERRTAAEHERRTRRREIIQAVKAEVMACWVHGAELKAEALQEIERALNALAVEDLPHAELVAIARGIRDRFGAQALQAEQTELQAQQAAAGALLRRRRLIAHGTAYAEAQLSETEGLSLTDRWRIEERVKAALEDIAGGETTEEIEDLVEDLFEREGLVWDDEDEDD